MTEFSILQILKAAIEHYIIHYTVHPEVSKGKFACSLGLRYLSPNGTIVVDYVMLNSGWQIR